MSVLADRHNDVRRRLGDVAVTLLTLVQRDRDSSSLGDVADQTHDQNSVFRVYLPSGDLRFKLTPAAVHQIELELLAHAGRLREIKTVYVRRRIPPDESYGL